MDPSLDTVEHRTLECTQDGRTTTLASGFDQYQHDDPESSVITLREENPSPNWELPSILPTEVYKLR